VNSLMALTLNGVSFGQLAIFVVVAAAVIALVYIALTQFGVSIPTWVTQVFWVLVVAFVVIIAIKLVLSM